MTPLQSVAVGNCGRLVHSRIEFKIIKAEGASSLIKFRHNREEVLVEDDYLRANAEQIEPFEFRG